MKCYHDTCAYRSSDRAVWAEIKHFSLQPIYTRIQARVSRGYRILTAIKIVRYHGVGIAELFDKIYCDNV
jgi:hypothetical protein